MQHLLRPVRPSMPTAHDEARSQHQFTRASILQDDFDDTLRKWMEEHVDPERLEIWGIPDTSANPLAVTTKQLTTPGLYATRPTWRHQDTARNEALIGPGGHLDQAAYHTRAMWVQYMTVGSGNWFVRMDVVDGKLTTRPVSPHNVYISFRPDAPSEPAELWELQLRWWDDREEWVYTWDTYDLGDLRTGRAPSYRVMGIEDSDGLREDLSNVFLLKPDGTTGALDGVEYPWVRSDGSPRFPYVSYNSVDTGAYWNQFDKRGLHRGTLNAALYATYTGHCARDATGSMVLLAGLDPVSVDIHAPDGSIVSTVSRAVRTMKVTPGCLIYHTLQEGVTPWSQEIGPGANLPDLWDFTQGYETRLAMRTGLNPSDAERQNANPTSGAALHISNQQKREFSNQVQPLFRRSDLDAVELAAIVMRAAGVGDFDERGYSITYAEIPRSPQEQQAIREGLSWKVERGQMSRVGEYQALNPGASEEDALMALVDVAVSNAQVESMTEAAIQAAGLAPTPPPALPADPPPVAQVTEE